MTHTQKTWLRRIGIAAAVLAAFALGMSRRGGDSGAPADGATGSASHTDAGGAVEEATIWTCSMHPQIQLPNPGSCPICGMDLIPLRSNANDADGPRTLTLSPSARTLAKIQTTRVERRPVHTEMRMVGKLEADETRVRQISAWVPGRIDKLHVDYTGVRVRAGQKLFDLYSPELHAAQQELLGAVRASTELERSTLGSTRESASRTTEAARERLRLLGLTPEQISGIESSGVPSDHVTIVAPISGTVLHKTAIEGAYVQTGAPVYTIADLSVLWLQLDVYESDLALIATGQRVAFETETFPGETFAGTVAFVDPVLDDRSRTVRVRVDVRNSELRLKPGMFAHATVSAGVKGSHGEEPLVIPSTAPLLTGRRAVVYVADPAQEGQYHGREVVLGPEGDGVYVVREGLEEGEEVVSNGSFKIDSALQILAKGSMMSPEGGVPAPGHAHGSQAPGNTGVGGTGSTGGMGSSEGTGHAGHVMGSDTGRVQLGAAGDVPSAFRDQLARVLSVYIEVSNALSHDDDVAARNGATRLPQTLGSVDPSLLSAESRMAWTRAEGDLKKFAATVAKAPDLTATRIAFYDLSVAMIETVRVFRVSDGSPVFVYHCPMAMSGAGADWLQSKKGTENPYYGSQMFTCGSETEDLTAGGTPESTGGGR